MPHGQAVAAPRRRLALFAAAAFSLLTLAAPALADPFAILAGARGKVEVTPARGGTPERASFGRELERGDKVAVGAGGSATVYFSDGNVIELGERSSVTIGGRVAPATGVGPAASLPAGVYASVSRYVTRGSRETGLVAQSSMRSGSDALALAVSPRNTNLRETRPRFTWRAVDGTSRYRVTLSGGAGELWSREASGSTIEFPAEAEPLADDADYLWRVDALAESGRLRTDEAIFHVVSAQVHEAVQRDLGQIARGAGPGQPATHFLSGSYLFDRGLYRDAVEQFQALARLVPDSPAPHEALGNVYRAIGLMDLAAAEYQKALELTRTP